MNSSLSIFARVPSWDAMAESEAACFIIARMLSLNVQHPCACVHALLMRKSGFCRVARTGRRTLTAHPCARNLPNRPKNKLPKKQTDCPRCQGCMCAPWKHHTCAHRSHLLHPLQILTSCLRRRKTDRQNRRQMTFPDEADRDYNYFCP